VTTTRSISSRPNAYIRLDVMARLARGHFERARRFGEDGVHYDADADHYHCPRGERLALHLIDSQEPVAVYRAPASACAVCTEKARCTPHTEGRQIYRPLAAWTETDVGRFHQWLSLLMAAGAKGEAEGINSILFRRCPGTLARCGGPPSCRRATAPRDATSGRLAEFSYKYSWPAKGGSVLIG
jgi:hypothetical protein